MGPKNKLTDLNNILFEALERLNDNELQGDELREEIERSRAMTNISQQIIGLGQLAVNAKKVANEYGDASGLGLLLEDGCKNE